MSNNSEITASTCNQLTHPESLSDYNRRLFTGKRPVAYLDDLLAVHDLVVKWLMGESLLFGEYGYVPLTKNGTIDPKYIGELDVDIPNYDAGAGIKNLHLSESVSQVAKKMICPFSPNVSDLFGYYGYLPGQIINGITFNGILSALDIILFETTDGILFANNYSTYFVVTLYDAHDNVVFTVLSAKITGNSSDILMGDNRQCTLLVTNFKEELGLYFGNIRLRINLSHYFSISTKFKISVSYLNTESPNSLTKWSSGALFYCRQSLPDLSLSELTVKIYTNGSMRTPKLSNIYGIDYITDGYVKVTLTNIKNINADAIAFGSKVLVESNIFEGLYEFNLDDLTYTLSNKLSITNIATWSHKFKIKENFIYPKSTVYIKLTIKNGYGLTSILLNNVQITHNNHGAYIDTFINKNVTDSITEAFDGNVILSEYTSYLLYVKYYFDTLNLLLLSEYLQVIPNVGLFVPNYFDTNVLNHQIRHFKRIFFTKNNIEKKVFGGTFIFGNLTEQEFRSDAFSVRISVDDGATWYDLKHLKDGLRLYMPLDNNLNTTQNNDIVKGIFCLTEPYEDGLAVRFALPWNLCFNHTDIICFDLGINAASSISLTYIKLRNEDNTLEF